MSEPTSPPRTILDRIIAEQTLAQFAATDVALTPVAHPGTQPAQAELAGMVGFTSESMRGTVMIASTFSLFARSRPAALRDQPVSAYVARDWLYLRDWASELTNQLVGRIKNRLVAFGVSLRVSTPTALSGSALAFATPSSKRTKPLVFTSGSDELWVFFDAIIEPELELSPQGEAAAEEGELILF